MDGLPLWRSGDHVLALDAVRVGPSTSSSRAKRGDPGAAAAALRSPGSPRRFAPRDDDFKARRALVGWARAVRLTLFRASDFFGGDRSSGGAETPRLASEGMAP